MNELRTLINTHIDKWIAAGKYALPDVNDCLTFIGMEIFEMHDARIRLNPAYTRNNEKAAQERNVAIELFDALKMCFVYERITGFTLKPVNVELQGSNIRTMNHLAHLATGALTFNDQNLESISHALIQELVSVGIRLMHKLGFDLMDIAREKLHEMDVKRGCDIDKKKDMLAKTMWRFEQGRIPLRTVTISGYGDFNMAKR